MKPGEKPVGTATIGYGAISVNGKPVQAGDKITKEQADQIFNSQVASYQNWKNFVQKPLTASQQEALTSFEYNLGSGIWNKNAMNILAAVNKGDMITAGNLMQAYNKARGQYIPGLANRRANEAKLLLA